MELLPDLGEDVFFFSIDDQSNQQCNFRQTAGLQGQISDCLVYYKNRQQTVLCIVELKGSNLGAAVEQINNTHTVLRRVMQGHQDCRSIQLKAYIFKFGSSPNVDKRRIQVLQARLSAQLGAGNHKITSLMEIGRFLREHPPP